METKGKKNRTENPDPADTNNDQRETTSNGKSSIIPEDCQCGNYIRAINISTLTDEEVTAIFEPAEAILRGWFADERDIITEQEEDRTSREILYRNAETDRITVRDHSEV